MTTNNALLAAVRANPGEDAPRLVWADWLADAGRELDAIMQRIIAEPGRDDWRLDYAAELERTAGAVECGCDDGSQDTGGFTPWGEPISARCNICDGTGRVSDGRAELAEFVRVQVELAARDDERCRCRECQPTGQHHNGPCRSPLKPLRTRERELWPAVRVWFEGDGVNLWCGRWPGGNTATPAVLVSRGLPSVVRCTLAEWMGGEECPHCDRGVQWRSMPPDSRVCESCGGDPERRKPGTGRTPGIGPRLAQRWPITEVQVEKQPMGSGREFLWLMREDRPSVASPGSAALPASVFDLLKGYRKYIRGARAKCYPDEPAARAALSDAAIAWARSQPIEEGRS